MSADRFDSLEAKVDQVLSAISSLAERINRGETRLVSIEQKLVVVEARLGAVEGRIGVLENKFERFDQKINSIARNLLAPTECIALGIADARGMGEPPAAPLPRAAKSR